MGKIYNQEEQQVEYSEGGNWRRLWRAHDEVYKISNFCMGDEWREQFSNILALWELPAFDRFLNRGYVTKFIDGPDLHGNLPFSKGKGGCILTAQQKLRVIDIFAKAREVGNAIGYTLGDITCGNMILHEDSIYLIDYEVVVDFPLSVPYTRIWNNTLRIIFG